jgi:FtsH-binding integral membrane protein
MNKKSSSFQDSFAQENHLTVLQKRVVTHSIFLSSILFGLWIILSYSFFLFLPMNIYRSIFLLFFSSPLIGIMSVMGVVYLGYHAQDSIFRKKELSESYFLLVFYWALRAFLTSIVFSVYHQSEIFIAIFATMISLFVFGSYGLFLNNEKKYKISNALTGLILTQLFVFFLLMFFYNFLTVLIMCLLGIITNALMLTFTTSMAADAIRAHSNKKYVLDGFYQRLVLYTSVSLMESLMRMFIHLLKLQSLFRDKNNN